jgi:hypothetical protein
MLADGVKTVTDLGLLRDQREVFGPVASTPTAWRVLAAIDIPVLAVLSAARAAARETARLQAAETGRGIPPSRTGGRCSMAGCGNRAKAMRHYERNSRGCPRGYCSPDSRTTLLAVQAQWRVSERYRAGGRCPAGAVP